MILPWKIMSVTMPRVTLKQFYEEKVASLPYSASSFQLESAFLGQSKSSLDQIAGTFNLPFYIKLWWFFEVAIM